MDDIITKVENSGYYEDWHQFRLKLERYQDRFGNPMPLELRLELASKVSQWPHPHNSTGP